MRRVYLAYFRLADDTPGTSAGRYWPPLLMSSAFPQMAEWDKNRFFRLTESQH